MGIVLGLIGASLFGLALNEAAAQLVPVNPQRDCQTIRTCNFTRHGVYRGCLSTYSCRVCRFFRAACHIDGGRRICQELRCTWG